MDDIRAQLDALMGQDRNLPLQEQGKRRCGGLAACRGNQGTEEVCCDERLRGATFPARPCAAAAALPPPRLDFPSPLSRVQPRAQV